MPPRVRLSPEKQQQLRVEAKQKRHKKQQELAEAKDADLARRIARDKAERAERAAPLVKPAQRPVAQEDPCEARYIYDKATDKFRFENWRWAPYLVDKVIEPGEFPKFIGKNPMKIPASILVAAGHIKRPASMAMRAYARDMGWPKDYDRDRGLHRLRELCLACSSGSTKEVKECSIINCPLWAHRLGKSPFNKRANRENRDS